MCTGLLHADKTFVLRKHIFAVRNELGAGWSEFVYHEALARSLDVAGIPVQSQPHRQLQIFGVKA